MYEDMVRCAVCAVYKRNGGALMACFRRRWCVVVCWVSDGASLRSWPFDVERGVDGGAVTSTLASLGAYPSMPSSLIGALCRGERRRQASSLLFRQCG
jgi:hypothetical protein